MLRTCALRAARGKPQLHARGGAHIGALGDDAGSAGGRPSLPDHQSVWIDRVGDGAGQPVDQAPAGERRRAGVNTEQRIWLLAPLWSAAPVELHASAMARTIARAPRFIIEALYTPFQRLLPLDAQTSPITPSQPWARRRPGPWRGDQPPETISVWLLSHSGCAPRPTFRVEPVATSAT